MIAAAAAIGESVTDFSAGTRFPERGGEVCAHVYVVEFARNPGSAPIEIFSDVLDKTLCATNADYRAHRPLSLAAPVVEVVPPGTFAAWMKRRGKLGGQHKVPRIINDGALFDDLRAFCAAASNGGSPGGT